ncbi:hypothetical protein CLOSBL3_12722 [Clostridiaceae bacterium BL-3]|nr:hypothetical protein CLOSBL3_12722 [Clostridiaceae bacterium BL-3]
MDSNGVVTAVGQGSATITVTTKNSGKTASCSITVEGQGKGYSDYESDIDSLVSGITSKVSSTPDDWTVMELNKLSKPIPSDYLTNLEQKIKNNPGEVLKQPTDYARTVIGVVAAGGDPTNFAGQNLVEKIYDYDPQAMDDSGANGAVFALLALDSSNFSIPDKANWTRQNLVNKILSYRTGDGGWTYQGDTADPDMTSMAISALAPYKSREDVESDVDTAIDKLSSMQSEDGGFASWGVENPNSVEMVIIGLCDNGIDPVKDSAFIKNEQNPMDALKSFKVVDNSGFWNPWNTDESGNIIKTADSYATEQGLRALAACKLFNQGRGSVYKNFVDYNTDINNLVNGITSEISSSPDDWTVMELNKLGKTIPSNYLTDLEEKIENSPDKVLKQPTDYARTVIGIVASGGNPTNFAGQNLVEKIYDYDEQSMEEQGIGAYVYALIALDSADFSVPEGSKWTRDKLVDKILDCRTNDKGWTYWGDSADTDMTSMAISALAPYKDEEDVKSAVDAAVDKLSSMQREDGGFTYSQGDVGAENPENPNSVAMAIIGICDNGIDPASDARFIKNGGNAISALLKFAVSDNTGFWSPWGSNQTTDSSATEQGLRALADYKLFKDGKGSVYKNFADVHNTDIPVDSITLDKTQATLKEEETLKLTPTISPDNATEALVWESDKPDVVAVDADGKVKAVSVGIATITVKPQYNTHAQPVKCTVTVNAK